MPIVAKRGGPAQAKINIGFVGNSSSSHTYDAGDCDELEGNDGLASSRKSFNDTGTNLRDGSAGPNCVQILHDHNLSVGQYAYYSMMVASTYSNNNHGYRFNAGGLYYTCILQEIL